MKNAIFFLKKKYHWTEFPGQNYHQVQCARFLAGKIFCSQSWCPHRGIQHTLTLEETQNPHSSSHSTFSYLPGEMSCFGVPIIRWSLKIKNLSQVFCIPLFCHSYPPPWKGCFHTTASQLIGPGLADVESNLGLELRFCLAFRAEIRIKLKKGCSNCGCSGIGFKMMFWNKTWKA